MKNSSIETSIGVVVTEFPPSILLLPSPPTHEGPIRSSARIDQSGGWICGLRQLLLFISLEPPIRTERKIEIKKHLHQHQREIIKEDFYHTSTTPVHLEKIQSFFHQGVRLGNMSNGWIFIWVIKMSHNGSEMHQWISFIHSSHSHKWLKEIFDKNRNPVRLN